VKKRWAAMATGLLVAMVLGGIGGTSADSRGSFTGTGSGLDFVDLDLLFVGAHPDDSFDGVFATLARYVRDEGWKAGVIVLTRGEGGGNAIGRETGRALGLIREEEDRRALALAGVDRAHYLGLQDFYFTLSAEETAARWGDRFVCDLVRHVRLERPEVIVTMWPGPGTHGQHQMASRAATLAFEKAGDPGFCPEQVTGEFLRPFAPLKLYYFPRGRKPEDLVSVPTSDVSRSAALRYADLRALANAINRSQGYDRTSTFPAAKADPETFLLARSRVSTSDPEQHLLEGALLPAGSSPAGILLEVEPAAPEAVLGRELPVTVRFGNTTDADLVGVGLDLTIPEDWTVRRTGTADPVSVLASDTQEVEFHVTPAPSAKPGTVARLLATYTAESKSGAIAGRNIARVQIAAPLRAAWKPLLDIAGYREFARATRTEWVIPALPARLPLVVGRPTMFAVELENRGSEVAKGELAIEPLPGVMARPVPFSLAAGQQS
jgi:LmbE family N-acetylglucosaminyl deacetylase